MINTIFWFAEDMNEYNSELRGQGVSDKTIVFIKDTGEIYINNKKYGKTILDIVNSPELVPIFEDDSVLKQLVQLMIDALKDKHDTDIATLQGSIASLAGTVSSNRAAHVADKEESDRKFRGIEDDIDRLGDAIDLLGDDLDTAEQNAATARLNIVTNVNLALSDMNSALASAVSAAQSASARAESIYNSVDSKVSTAVAAAIALANISGNFDNVGSSITLLENGLLALSTRVGKVVDSNGNITYDVYESVVETLVDDNTVLTSIGAKVSPNAQLTQELVNVVSWWASEVSTYALNGNTFAQMVAAVGGSGNNGGNGSSGVDAAYVTAQIQLALTGYVATSELNAKILDCQAFTTVQAAANTASANVLAVQGDLSTVQSTLSSLSDDIDALETTLTGFNTTIAGLTTRISNQEAKTSFVANWNANSGATFSLTANEAETLMNSIVQHANAVATIQSVVTTDDSGVDINTIVDGKIATAMTGYATQSWVDNNSNVATAVSNLTNAVKNSNDQLISSADILTKANTNEANITALTTTVSGHTTSIAGLETSTLNNSTAISGVSSRVSTVEGAITTINNAGFISSAGLDSAVAALFAKNTTSDSKTNVNALISAAVSDGVSNITLTADKITFEGYSNFTSAVQAVNLSANKITSGTLSADRIDATNLKVKAANITGKLTASQINATDLHVSAANIDGTITATSLAIKNASNETVAALNSDGSGQIAKSGISWTTSGGLTLSLDFLKSLVAALRSGASSNVAGDIAGQTETMIVAGNTVPPTKTIFGIDYPLIKTDASVIYYYNFSDASSSGQYPYSGSDSEKRQWLQNSVSGWMFEFKDGLLQNKAARDIYTGQSIDNLSGSTIDQRVDVINKLSTSSLASLTGLNSANFKGEFTTNIGMAIATSYNAGISGTSTDDWIIVGNSADPINSLWYIYKWGTLFGSSTPEWCLYFDANGGLCHLYQHSK